MQVMHHHDHVKSLGRERGAFRFQIDRLDLDRQTSPARVSVEFAQSVQITIDRRHAPSQVGQPQRVAAATTGHVQRGAGRQQVPVHGQPGGRRGSAHDGSPAGFRRLAIACPATQPDDHAHWKLNPPSRPSTSRISPTRYRPSHVRDAIVR